jgi:hypothetical protein
VAQFSWVTGTHQYGRAKSTAQSDPKTVEFVPKAELDRALEEVQRLREKNERLQREIERLQKELEEAHRAVKRQTAPFSRRKRKANPKPNGRKSGRHTANTTAVLFQGPSMSSMMPLCPSVVPVAARPSGTRSNPNIKRTSYARRWYGSLM